MTKKRLVIDLDGTLVEGEYHFTRPKWDVIDRCNKLYKEGWEVIVFTARGMNTFDGDAQKCDTEYRLLSESTLMRWGILYTRLQFGKPAATVYVDDLALRPDEFANQKI